MDGGRSRHSDRRPESKAKRLVAMAATYTDSPKCKPGTCSQPGTARDFYITYIPLRTREFCLKIGDENVLIQVGERQLGK